MRDVHAVPGQGGRGLGPVRRVSGQAGVVEGLVQLVYEKGVTRARHRAGIRRRLPSIDGRRFLLPEIASRAFCMRADPARAT
ncbi:conserved protein of unknown function [Burkholderia multivorans]